MVAGTDEHHGVEELAAAAAETGLLRVATAGSVDDGKSTLIGRLLHDAKGIFEDQLEAVAHSSRQRGFDETNLALLTDGLRAEREQGITIDVAYRYFATPRRSFILADTPGHVQYTRNMVTGASTADVALVLIDARRGPNEQSMRHATIAGLLGIRHLVVCVNKMDLVGWNEQAFRGVEAAFERLGPTLGFEEVTAIPVSALHGDNVVDRSSSAPWYDGPILLDHLESVDVGDGLNVDDPRFPVQYVVTWGADGGHHDRRQYAGTVASGVFHAGDEVVVLPSGRTTSIESVETLDGPIEIAGPRQSVALRLADELDVSRGDMIVAPSVGRTPSVERELTATVCWMTDRPLTPGSRWLLKHTTRAVKAAVDAIDDRLDVVSGDRSPTESLELNDLGQVRVRLASPLVFDPYAVNRTTGSFILIDEATNATAGAGLIL